MAGICEWVDVGGGLRGYYGEPEGPGPHPCVVVYIEAFGVNDHFQKLTQRLADDGFATITPDIYDGEIYAYDDLDGAIGKLKALDDDTVMNQTEQCLDWLSADGSGSQSGRCDRVLHGRSLYVFGERSTCVTFQRCRFVLWWRYRPEGRFRRPESTFRSHS